MPFECKFVNCSRQIVLGINDYCPCSGEFSRIRVFHSLYKVGRNGNFVFKGFNNSKKKLTPVGVDLMLQIVTGLGVQCLTK